MAHAGGQTAAPAQPPPSVIDRLRAREEQRVAEASRRQSDAQAAALPSESAHAFLERFAARRAELEAGAQAVIAPADAGADAGAARLQRLQELGAEAAALEQSVAAAAYFLPPYDLRQATLAVNALRERLDAAIAAQQPRKKFSFRRAAPPAVAAAASSREVTNGDSAAAVQERSAAAADGTPARQGFALRTLRGETVVLRAAEVSGQDVTLADLEDCNVFLLAPLAALFVHRLKRCVLVAGPVAGATFMEDVAGCRMYVAARQVRVHSAAACDLYLRVLSNPVIEHSSTLRFGPYDPSYCYPGCGADLAQEGLAQENDLWAQVQDFGWLRAAQSPHWAVLPEAERVPPPAPAP